MRPKRGCHSGRRSKFKITGCTVSGAVSASGTSGGITAVIEGSDPSLSVIENCISNVTIDVNGGIDTYVGGIAGRRLATVLWTAGLRRGITVPPGYRAVMQRLEELPDSRMPLIFITAMYPVRLAEAGSGIVGGITGKYASGRMKVARFEGIIGQSGTGAAGHRGTFIGHREAGIISAMARMLDFVCRHGEQNCF